MKLIFFIILLFQSTQALGLFSSKKDVIGPYSSVFSDKDWKLVKDLSTAYLQNRQNICCIVMHNAEPMGLEGDENITYASYRFKKLGNQLYKIIRSENKSDGSLWCITYARVLANEDVFDQINIYTSDECSNCQSIIEQLIIKWELNN